VWVDVPRELTQALAEGRGDVVIGPIPLNGVDSAGIDRTVALRQVRYVVVTRAEDRHIRSKHHLYGLRAGLSNSAPTWPLLERLSAGHPAILRVPTDGMAPGEVYARLAAGSFDFTVVGSDGSDAIASTDGDLRAAFELTGSQPVSWLVRASNPQLRDALNHHLNTNRLALRVHEAYKDDLKRIVERGVLRVITRPDPDNFFMSKGERAGFEYDMIREFALRRGLRIEVVMADSDEQMLSWLKSGVGDVVTARVDSVLADADADLAVTRMYHYVAPVLVGRADAKVPARAADGTILVSRASVFAEMFGLGRAHPLGNYKLLDAQSDLTPSELLNAVAAKQADYTVVEATRLNELLGNRADLRAVMSLQDFRPYRFTVRSNNPALRHELDEFLRQEYGSESYNAALRRYFDNEDLYALRGAAFDHISPYDNLVKRYAERYGFDWRLIVAQMYEESRFEANAVSSRGARGLMQVLPLTARSLGFRNLDKPDLAIHAGVKYLHKQRDRFEETLSVADRTWFALAAYHAGYDRVQAARRRAERLGLDPNRWFANVEKAMLDISRNRTGARTYRGGRATVAYVGGVRSRYESYLQLQSAIVVASL
jgi:membrane-bound lytic murein transglycosylase F